MAPRARLASNARGNSPIPPLPHPALPPPPHPAPIPPPPSPSRSPAKAPVKAASPKAAAPAPTAPAPAAKPAKVRCASLVFFHFFSCAQNVFASRANRVTAPPPRLRPPPPSFPHARPPPPPPARAPPAARVSLQLLEPAAHNARASFYTRACFPDPSPTLPSHVTTGRAVKKARQSKKKKR